MTSSLARFALAGVAAVLLFLASAGCFLAAIILVLTGKIRRAYVPEPTANSAYLEGFALYLVLFIALGLILRQFNLGLLNWEWLALLIIPIVMGWIARRGGANRTQIQKALGWQWGRGPHVEITLGIAGFLASLPLLAIGLYFSARLTQMAGAEPNHPFLGLLTGDRWHILAVYGLGCGLAPVMEETMFRGALFHHLRRRWGWIASAGLVSFIFAIIHPQGWTLVPGLGAIALMLAALREWRGSLLAPVAAHACANFLTISMLLLLLS
jgi:membrane protease YdiL (CAAX protease family)